VNMEAASLYGNLVDIYQAARRRTLYDRTFTFL